MKIIFKDYTLATTSVITTSTTSGVVDVASSSGFSMVSNIAVDTNAAGTWAAASVTGNHVTIAAHGYKTGLKGQVTTVGALPTGLVVLTNYFIIVVDANTVKFASSYANAIAGTAIAITGGTGNSTFTPTALAGATVQAQWSIDNETWVSIGSPTAITATMVFGITYDEPRFKYFQLVFDITAGSLSIVTKAQVNQES